MEKQSVVPSSVLRRVLATVGCVLAFAVMASIFSPDTTRAGGVGDPWPGIPPKSIEYSHEGPSNSATSTTPGAHPSQRNSVDPHEGLQSLGIIEDRGYTIHIYATDGGPRYTIYENATESECGALLTEHQVHQAFPDLQLPTMEFNAAGPLMMVEPGNDMWW